MRDELAPRRAGFDLLGVLGWDEPTRRARFSTSAMKRVTLAQMKRNAIYILAGLLGQARGASEQGGADTPSRERIIARLRDTAWDAREPESVRAAARAALTKCEP